MQVVAWRLAIDLEKTNMDEVTECILIQTPMG